MNPLALLLLTLVPAGPDPLVGAAANADPEPVLRLWMNNNRQYREGERARVQVEARDDGYLLVINYDTEGRLRVLFPVDPRDDNFVQAGRRYEIRGRGDRESFITTRDGDGLVYAAVSPDPFDFREFDAGGNWDYNRLYVRQDPADPEAELSELVQRMTSERGFDYDVLPYRVWGYRDYRVTSVWYPRPYGFYDDYYCDWWYRPSLFGCRYWWPSTSRFYFSFGYYSPYRYGYGYYDPYRWYRYPWYGHGGYYRNRDWPVVVGRPRGYTIVRRGSGGTRVDRVPGSFGGGSFGARRPAVIDYRPRGRDGRARPGAVDRPEAGRSPDRGSAPRTPDRPRARRVPPSGDNRPVMERERPGGDRPVQTEDRVRRPVDPDRRPEASPRSVRGSDPERRPERARPGAETGRQVRFYDVPANRESDAPARGPRVERPRDDAPRPRAVAPERRSSPPSYPRAESPRRDPPRVSPPARSEPSRREAPRVSAPRSSPPSAGRPASGGRAPASRPSGGSGRPRGRP